MKKAATGEIRVGECYKAGWRATSLLLCGIMVLYFLAIFAIARAIGVFASSAIAYRILHYICGILLFQPAAFGLEFYFLKKIRGSATGIKALFAGFKRYKSVVVVAAVFIVFSALGWLPGEIIKNVDELPQDRESAEYRSALAVHIAVSMVGYLIALAISIFFIMAPYLVLDRGFGAKRALKTSWRMINGHKGATARLVLLGFAVFVLGALALLVGIIPAMVVCLAAWAAFYEELCKRHPELLAMDKAELARILKVAGFRKDSYDLEGGLENNRYCLTRKEQVWEVYYVDRGSKLYPKQFPTESEACEYLLGWLHKDPANRKNN